MYIASDVLLLTSPAAFQEYSVLSDIARVRVLKNEHRIPWSTYVGVSGMPGEKTGYVPCA